LEKRLARALSGDSLLEIARAAARGVGAKPYLVGGTVRDLLIGRPTADLDLACENAPAAAGRCAELLGTRPVALGRGRFQTWRVPAGERYVDWAPLHSDGLAADLARRDFTVNAIAFDLDAGLLVDPNGGLGDLSARVIRMTSPRALAEDPLRILRAYRLLAGLDGFELDAATEGLIARRAATLARSAAERIRHEAELLLAAPSPSSTVRRMDRAGILTVVFPELEPLRGLGQNVHHHLDALEHTLEALDALDGPPAWLARFGIPPQSPRPLLIIRLGALLHDLGKASTRTVGPDGRVHFYGHPKVSADLARAAMKRLRFSKEVEEAVATLCLHHLRPLGLVKSGSGRTALRRLVHDLGPLLGPLLALARADKTASRGPEYEANLAGLDELATKALEVARTDGAHLARLPRLVDGLQALEILGLARPGPELGRALDALMERQVAGAISSREEAREFLRRYRQKHPPAEQEKDQLK
jgi:putative nucleotidyltransferase with HDIG domain